MDKDFGKVLVKRLITNLAAGIPFFIGGGMILLTKGSLISTKTGIACFIMGFTGVIIIIRKKGVGTLAQSSGKVAVIEGIIFTSICWVSAIVLIVFGN